MESEPKVPASKSWSSRLGHALIAQSENKGCLPLLYRVLKHLTFWTVVFYCLALILVMSLLSHVGERNVTTAFLLFVPPSVWWLPALPLAAAALLLHRRALLLLLVMMLWFSHSFLGWRSGGDTPETTPKEGQLRVMTYNRGQHMNQSLQPFKNATRPDILVFQEAFGKAAGFAAAEEYAEFTHTRSVGEHTLLSRFPILEEKELPALPGKPSKAVRFVLDWNGRHIALYSVHLQTPREVLEHQMRGSFLYGVLGFPGTPWAEKRQKMQTFWDDQIADAQLVLKAAREDSLPVILAGDFNSPHVGYVHRLMAAELGDAHDQTGGGFGWSFPGVTRNPLSAGGPWMRIDYVFFGKSWKAVACVTEPKRPSQHRAVMAVLEFQP